MNINSFISSLPKIRVNGPVSTGCYITATRHDGRIFAGKVVKVVSYLPGDRVKRPGDTLVTVQAENNSCRSFYIGDVSEWMVTN